MAMGEHGFDAILRDLVSKRSSFKGRLTKFKNNLDILVNCQSISAVELNKLSIKLKRFEALFSDFDELQTQIEVINFDSQDVELNIRETIEQDFCHCIATAQQLIERSSPQKQQNNSLNESNEQTESEPLGFKLPIIKIPTFDGSYYKWLEFKDTFMSLVHENSKIKDVHKFYYLNSYLEGEAARVICNLEVMERNYIKAWQLLCDRYDNKRLLINNHLKSLFSMESIRETDKSFRFVIDHVKKNLRALQTLGLPTDSWDMLVIYIVTQKLDQATCFKWEESRSLLKDIPSLNDFFEFLKNRADVFETINRNKMKRNSNINSPVRQGVSPQSFLTCRGVNLPSPSKVIPLCLACKGKHRIYECPTFKNRSVEDRLSLVASLKLCCNCLRNDHNVERCRLPSGCKLCKQRHNTLLHIVAAHNGESSASSEAVSMASLTNTEVLLCTAQIEVINPSTNEGITVRALLDSGSQSSFLTDSVKQRLKLTPLNDSTNITGIGDTKLKISAQRCHVRIQSKCSSFITTLSCLVLPKLTGKLPRVNLDIKHLNISNFQLADPSFNVSSDVDVLLGAELFWSIIGSQQHSLGEHNPILHSSKLGWLIAGPITSTQNSTSNNNNNQVYCTMVHDDDLIGLNSEMSKFWELEKVPERKFYTEEELLCEEHFRNNTRRQSDGHFCVKLPLRCNRDCLGDSHVLAERRFFNLERRFSKQPLLKQLYVDFINEYKQLNHLSVYDNTSFEPSFYLPHHPVLKLNSESTKLRVVFDASARTTSGFSVNDLQMVGPNIQDSLFNILVRFRQYKYVISADIEKMYRCVSVDETDRSLQLILWREDESQPLKAFQLNTVTYGFSSSSFLSTRCLWQCGEECDDANIKNIIQNDFYIDDLLTGAQSEEDLRYIQHSVSEALSKGGFHLRKYRSNLSNFVESSSNDMKGDLTISNAASTLGIGWTFSSDDLNFPIEISQPDTITKRTILSYTFKVFDPLGLLSLCTIKPKILIQRLWSEPEIGWDDKVPANIECEWLRFIRGLSSISTLRIPRQALIDHPVRIEMHCFCDASERAYGACIYLKSYNSENQAQVHLLCSKSRVAPIKSTTIPRLELCGALLGSQLSNTATQALRCQIHRRIFWTDSKVVLGWLRTSKKPKTFVANRVAAINEISDPSLWRYVPTSLNPADLVSRGMEPSDVAECDFWWHGPAYLLESEVYWPSQIDVKSTNLPELKVHTVVSQDPIFDISRISRFPILQRTYAWVLRFVNNIKNPKNKLTGLLQDAELENSLNLLIKLSQNGFFQNELNLLSSNRPIKPKSILASLNPFIDSQGILRVGGRLKLSSFDYDKKHPILLHASSHLTKIIFNYEHIRLMHAGPAHLLASIRNRYWPVGGRDLARRTTRSCLKCRRFYGRSMINIMGNLPPERLINDFPFSVVGTDYAGPFMITDRKGRGAKITKCYLCIFICFTYKCIHLEAVSELSTDAFLLALRRFIARRGAPAKIFSDNGRNFVGAARELSEFLQSKEYQNSVLNFTAIQNITFKFIPAYAPHHGGLWESGVKLAKFHLKRVMGTAHLTFEELSSLFSQVEAILNSRPLCPLSPSPDDLQCLTPGHFLIGRPMTGIPAPSFLESNINRLDRFQRLEHARQHFWRRWANEYVGELQQRTKWRTKYRSLQVHDLVLLKEEAPPLCWRLGRVSQIYPGVDGVPRVADIKTSQGIVRRSLNRICLLSPPDEDQA